MQSEIFSINDHITECLKKIHPFVSRYTRPLFAVDWRDRPDLFASCVILDYDSGFYLITAAHALYEIAQSGSSVHLGGKEIRVIEGSVVRSSEDGNDPFDIAAIQLDKDLINSLNLEPLSCKMTTAGKKFERPHMHCMHGYPYTKNKTAKAADTRRKIFTTYGFTYAGTEPGTINFEKHDKNSRDHLCLSYGKGIDSKGNKAPPPKPKGMSGGGLWVVPNSFTVTDVYLEGILIEQHDGMVFATKIHRVIELIERGA